MKHSFDNAEKALWEMQKAPQAKFEFLIIALRSFACAHTLLSLHFKVIPRALFTRDKENNFKNERRH